MWLASLCERVLLRCSVAVCAGLWSERVRRAALLMAWRNLVVVEREAGRWSVALVWLGDGSWWTRGGRMPAAAECVPARVREVLHAHGTSIWACARTSPHRTRPLIERRRLGCCTLAVAVVRLPSAARSAFSCCAAAPRVLLLGCWLPVCWRVARVRVAVNCTCTMSPLTVCVCCRASPS